VLMDTIAEGARAGHETHGHGGHEHGGQGHEHDCPTVRVHVNNKEVFVHPGHLRGGHPEEAQLRPPSPDDLDELIKCGAEAPAGRGARQHPRVRGVRLPRQGRRVSLRECDDDAVSPSTRWPS